MSQPLTSAVHNSLRAMAQVIDSGHCPLCDDTGVIDHERCDNCTNGQVNGATCASCRGNPIFPVPPIPCPGCAVSQ